MKKKSKKEYRQRLTFYKFWWPVMSEFKLSPTEALTMCLIDGLSKKKGFCFMGEEELARQLNVTKPTVCKAIGQLKKDRLLFDKWSSYRAKLRMPSDKWTSFLEKVSRNLDRTAKFVDEMEE